MYSMLRAHGLDAGPTQQPLLTGLVAGALACVPAVVVLMGMGSLAAISDAVELPVAAVALAHVAAMSVFGLVYGWLFGRGANDRGGAWLFGMAFGFIVWMLGPVPVLQLVPSAPVLVGQSATGLFLGQLVWGLCLGISFPFLHRLVVPRPRGRGGAADLECAQRYGAVGKSPPP